jgi:hypothetical protein
VVAGVLPAATALEFTRRVEDNVLTFNTAAGGIRPLTVAQA